MAYIYDIFISYKRDDEINKWIKKHLEPLLALAVELELGYRPVIYRDDRLKDGGTWPLDLGNALGRSKVLIPLWTKVYFHSKWCIRELSTILEREQSTNCRTYLNPNGLIIPLILHDCEEVKPQLKHIQSRPIRECFNVRMSRDSPLAEQLEDELSEAAKGIAHAIRKAPEWQPDWPQNSARSFMDTLWNKEHPMQIKVPKLV